MSAGLRWDGLEDLKTALRSLPARLTTRASTIVREEMEATQAEILSEYPLGPTGNLRRRVYISTIDSGPYGAGLMLKSAAPHALIFERGTVARQTKRGFPRGRMPARAVFGRAMSNGRRRAWHRLADLMRDEGLRVTEHGV